MRPLPLRDLRKPEPAVLGSVIGRNTVNHCNALIDDAFVKDAKLVCGGKAAGRLIGRRLEHAPMFHALSAGPANWGGSRLSEERYQESLAVSREDLHSSGWKLTLAQTAREGYSAKWQALSEAARSAIEQGRHEHGKVLWLLADACSMMLSPASQNEPFKPFAVFHDRRSVIPDDLSEADIEFFAQIVDAVDESWLKARLADLVWLKGKPRNAAFALSAIDAYRSIPLNSDTWVRGGGDCWSRAISLTRMLRAGAGGRLEQMEASIIAAFREATRGDGFLGLWLANLLRLNGLGREHRIAVAKKLEILATKGGPPAQPGWQ